MRFRCIRAHEDQFAIRMMCRVLDVSVSGYYRWRDRAPAARAVQDAALLERLREHHRVSRQTYGRLRLRAALRNDGVRVSAKRVRRLMKLGGIVVRTRRRYKATTNSKHRLPVAANLIERNFDVNTIGRADRCWAGDITYIATREGWLYLAVILDLFSRRVIGWSMSREMTAGLVINAFMMAVGRRRPPRGLIAHSDRGSQYASRAFQRALREHGVLLQHESQGGLLGQRRHRKFQRDDQDRVDSSVRMGDTGGGTSGRVRVHRNLVQCTTTAFDAGLPKPVHFRRATPGSGLTHFSTKSGQVQGAPFFEGASPSNTSPARSSSWLFHCTIELGWTSKRFASSAAV